MKQEPTSTAARERRVFLIFFATLGFAGCLSLVAGTLIAPFFVPDYDWVSDSISDLAAGNSSRIMDFALYGFAAGLIATALAAAHAHLGGLSWSVGTLALAALAVLVTIIAGRNEYGDRDSGGVVIHIQLVYGVGVCFLAAALGLTPGLAARHPRSRWTLLGLAALWAIAAPIFLLAPTSLDGLFERLLGLIAIGIVGTICGVFMNRGVGRPEADG